MPLSKTHSFQGGNFHWGLLGGNVAPPECSTRVKCGVCNEKTWYVTCRRCPASTLPFVPFDSFFLDHHELDGSVGASSLALPIVLNLEGGAMDAEQWASYLALAGQARNGNWFYFGAWAILIHDHMTMFDMEIELIWKKSWSLIKVLYLMNRYIPDISFTYGVAMINWIPDERFLQHCPQFSRVQAWLSLVALQCMQAILVHRIVCMYRYRRAVTIYITVGFAVNLVAGFILVANTMDVINTPIVFSSTNRTCIPVNFKTWTVASWYLMLCFDSLVFCLALYEGVCYLRETKQATRDLDTAVRARWTSERSIIYILMRDSIVFPLLGLLLSITNILAFYVFPVGAMQYTFTITALLSPILGCRLILHLRDAYYQPFSKEMQQSGLMAPSGVDPDFQGDGNAPAFAMDTVTSSTMTFPPPRDRIVS